MADVVSTLDISVKTLKSHRECECYGYRRPSRMRWLLSQPKRGGPALASAMVIVAPRECDGYSRSRLRWLSSQPKSFAHAMVIVATDELHGPMCVKLVC